jgi:hypothetical protein
VVEYTCNTNSQEAEAGGSRVQDKPGLGYIVRPCQKRKKRKKEGRKEGWKEERGGEGGKEGEMKEGRKAGREKKIVGQSESKIMIIK